MFVDCLERHLAVCAMRDLPRFAKHDPKFWNVISLLGPEAPTPPRTGFRDHHRAFFNDVRTDAGGAETGIKLVDQGTMRGILKFVDDRPKQPILVHCVAGISRSPAVALVLLLRGMLNMGHGDPIPKAIDTLISIRPQARPNPLVLRAGLGAFLSQDKVEALVTRIMADSRMVREKGRENFDDE